MCLSGASGAGKSLLLRAIADLIPHEGDAAFNNHACSETYPVVWRRRVGLLPAESYWWADRVGVHFEQLTAQCKDTWFAQLGFTKEVMDWEVARCSTGERQRLALLRLLCQLPQVLLLDEPTASLDPTSVHGVEDLLATIRQESSIPILWVSHDEQQIKRVASRHLRLVDGELRELSL